MQNQMETLDNPRCCLTCAVDNGNIDEIKKLLDSDGLSDAHAFSLGHDLLLKPKTSWKVRLKNFLLERNVEAIDRSKSNSDRPLYWNGAPLCKDLGTDNIKIMKSLLKAKDAVQEPTSLNAEPLHVATLFDNTEIAKVLLDHIYRDKNRPRCDVVKNNLETVKSLLQASIDVNERCSDRLPVYKVATQLAQEVIRKVLFCRLYYDQPGLYNVKAVRSWLRKTADVEERSYNNLTPLHAAARCGDTDRAAILLDRGADLNTVCASALGALAVAAIKEAKESLLELLLRKIPNMNAMVKNGDTLLHVAARLPISERQPRVVQLLLNKGCDIYARDKNNKDIVRIAIEKRNLSLIEQLIGARSDSESSIGDTQTKIFEYLRRYGFGVSEKDANYRSLLLHEAVQKGCLKIVEYLLNLGDKFNTEMKGENGATPLHVAIERHEEKIVKLLIKNKADVHAKDSNGRTPLHCASEISSKISMDLNIKIIKMLLDEGAYINAKRNDGATALHLASKINDFLTVSILLLFGADINIKCNDRETPVVWAIHASSCWRGYPSDVLRTLREHIIKMKTLERWVCEENLKAFRDDEYFHKQCTVEIEFMRRTNIGASNVSYYDLLTKGNNRLAFYSRNKDIVDGLETCKVKHMLRHYWNMLHCRYINGRKRVFLLDPSLRSFQFLTTNALPESVIIDLFDYLSNVDLKNLIKAAPLDESDN